jgi:hypothetical protein
LRIFYHLRVIKLKKYGYLAVWLLPASFLMFSCASGQQGPPSFDVSDLPAYRVALYASTDPEAKIIEREIASGPADLADEKKAGLKVGILTT